MRSAAARLLVLLLAAGCRGTSPPPPASPLAAEVQAATERGAAYLTGRQDPDGAWRSDVYGAFKGGDALTPLALRALLAQPPSGAVARAVARGLDYLAALAPGDDAEAPPPAFAVYTAAQAVEALSRSSKPEHRAALEAWRAELERRQLTGDLGWSEDDPFFGGWGYSSAVPAKPPPGAFQPPLLEANTSATVFALQGLAAAGGTAADEPACGAALIFLGRVQNFADPPSPFDDGGFFFIDRDPVRNKAGVAGTDEDGRARFRSYGSTTADGLRGLLLCGRSTADPRARAALAWLEEHFSASQHPGDFAPRLAADRDGLFYYWAASVTRTLRLAETGPELRPAGRPPVPWAGDLARELVARQAADGSWSNPVVTMREDEPVVASSMALLALSGLRDLVLEAPSR